jgi:hypothetical protein
MTVPQWLTPEVISAIAVRDVLSATDTLMEIPADQLRCEIDDLELAHARLSKIIKRICG